MTDAQRNVILDAWRTGNMNADSKPLISIRHPYMVLDINVHDYPMLTKIADNVTEAVMNKHGQAWDNREGSWTGEDEGYWEAVKERKLIMESIVKGLKKLKLIY
jgi:hypothetical protein